MSQTEKAEKISITLPPEMLASLRDKIDTGEYGSTSEVIRDAIRVWQNQCIERQVKLDLLREKLEKSANSGAGIAIDDVFKRIEAKHRKIIGISENEEI